MSTEKYNIFILKNVSYRQSRYIHPRLYPTKHKTSQYACNCTPVDDTGVPCYVADVGREFKFLLDVEIGAFPTLEYKKHSILSQYL